MNSLRKMLIVAIGMLPASRGKNRALECFGYTIDRTATIGPCLILNVGDLSMGAGARIGPFNVFRDLARLSLAEHSGVGQWNWVSASKELVAAGGAGSFTLGAHSAFTSRHYADVSGGLRVGEFTTIAGVRSTFITHGINWEESQQKTKGITIGSYCLISSNTCVTPGTNVSDSIVTGMGATLSGRLDSNNSLYVQSRAIPAKSKLGGLYFTRTIGRVTTSGPTHRSSSAER